MATPSALSTCSAFEKPSGILFSKMSLLVPRHFSWLIYASGDGELLSATRRYFDTRFKHFKKPPQAFESQSMAG